MGMLTRTSVAPQVPLHFSEDGLDILPLTKDWRSSWTLELGLHS
jgi:hypothetical protein